GDVWIEPDFERSQVGGTAVDIFLLGRTEGNVGAAAVGAPTVGARADTKTRVGKSDALVDFFLVSVYFRARNGIADLPEILDKFITRVIRGECEKPGALLFV